MSKFYYIIPIFVPHEGCPYDCIFCNQRKITGIMNQKDEGGNCTRISGLTVTETIQTYLKTIPHEDAKIEVAFFGGSFTGIPIEQQKELLQAADLFYKNGSIDGIRLSTRPDYIDREILDHLKNYAVSTIELGVQSLDDQVLKISNRGHTAEDVEKASKLIKEYGFSLGLQMMIGLPADTEDKMYQTAEGIIRLKPDIVRIYPALVIKGTALEVWYRSGKYVPLSLEKAVEICKNLLIKFETNGIKVIRIGLQPTENIMQGQDVVAGPFHPAFRELVESQIRLGMLEQAMKDLIKETGHILSLTIKVNPRAVSETIGIRKKNILALKEKYAIKDINIEQDESLERDKLIVESTGSKVAISKKEQTSVVL